MRPAIHEACVALLLALSTAACGATSEPAEGASEAEGEQLEVVPEPQCDRFELLGDLARDKESGLTWTRFVELDFATHADAAARCAERGMRLPVRTELETLLEPGRQSCDLPCGFFGNTCATLICDTEIAGSDDHWGVSFAAGALVLVPEAEPQGFVCVR